jgi:hypothetical protein
MTIPDELRQSIQRTSTLQINNPQKTKSGITGKVLAILALFVFCGLFICNAVGQAEYVKEIEKQEQSIEKRCNRLTQIRMCIIAPVRTTADPKAFMSSDFQRATLGDTIKDLIKNNKIPEEFDPYTAKQILQSQYNIY